MIAYAVNFHNANSDIKIRELSEKLWNTNSDIKIRELSEDVKFGFLTKPIQVSKFQNL